MGFWESLSEGLNEFGRALDREFNSMTNTGSGSSGGASSSFQDMIQRRSYSEAIGRYSNGSYSQEEMINLIKNICEQIGANNTPDTLIGRLYTKTCKVLERNDRQRPHFACMSFCAHDESECEACLAMRLKAVNAINMIDDPKEYRAQYEVAGEREALGPIRCSLCGAPIEPGAGACEYCGTAAFGGSGNKIRVNSEADIPNPVMAAYELVQQVVDWHADFLPNSDLYSMLMMHYEACMVEVPNSRAYVEDYRTQMARNFALKKSRMTYSEISRTAAEHGLDIPMYLLAYLNQENEIFNAAELRTKKTIDRMNDEYRKKREAENAQLEAIKQRAMQSKKEIQETLRQSQEKRTYYYSGGSGGGGSNKCCGTCMNYMPSSNKCAFEASLHITRNATDFCGKYSMK